MTFWAPPRGESKLAGRVNCPCASPNSKRQATPSHRCSRQPPISTNHADPTVKHSALQRLSKDLKIQTITVFRPDHQDSFQNAARRRPCRCMYFAFPTDVNPTH